MNRTDIYDYKRQMRNLERYIERQNISSKNKEIIFRFKDYCLMQGFSEPRIIRYYYAFKFLSRFLGKDFDKAVRKDIERVVAQINARESWSPSTKHDMKVMLKRFYKWLYGRDEEYTDEVKWIKTRVKRTDKKLPSDGELLLEEDIIKALEFTNNLRDKALISTLYEAGCRIGELCSIRIKDVSFDKLGTVLSITGKTGPRKVRVVSSTPYLSNWLNNHPLKQKRDAALWICIGNVNTHQKMDYDTIRIMIKKTFIAAGINKKHNPHIFRHSRATFLANHLTEFQMNQYFGWVQGSDMPSTYVHLSGKDIDNAVLRANGIEEKKENKPIQKSIICKRCDTINTSESVYCCKCGCVVDSVTALKLEQEEKQNNMFNDVSSEVVQRIIKKNPNMVAELVRDFVNAAKVKNVLQ